MLLFDFEMATRYHNLRVLMCLRLTAPQLLGMVKTEEPLDSNVISNIQWQCEKIEIMKVQLLGKAVLKCEITSESHGKCVYAISTWQCDAIYPLNHNSPLH